MDTAVINVEPVYVSYEHKDVTVLSARSHSENDPNVRSAFRRGLPRLYNIQGFMQPKTEPLALVAGGPSTRSHIEAIKSFPYVMACGSVHDYLVENGVTPSFAVCGDPDKVMVKFYQKVLPQTIYLLASHCDPKIFRHFKKRKALMALWHAAGEASEEAFKGEIVIGGGCTAALRAVVMANLLGYRSLHFFGFDSSYDEEGTHCYDYEQYMPGNMPEMKMCKVGFGDAAKHFKSSIMFVGQALQFFETVKALPRNIHYQVYGNGMIAAMVLEENRKIQEAREKQLNGADGIPAAGATAAA